MTIPTDLDLHFRNAASALDLIDVSYDVVETEIGEMLAATTAHGLAYLSFDPEPHERLEALARFAGPRVLRAPRAIDAVRLELDEYFSGARTVFDLSLDLRGLPTFTVSVLGELAKVPYGRTATYRDLAERVGNPKASRAIGTVMNRNRIPIILPCHRIVGTSGSLIGYAGGLELKEKLLRHEGAILA
jgi:methylated-DNA-[protein]-cysteine S-methyltransferase